MHRIINDSSIPSPLPRLVILVFLNFDAATFDEKANFLHQCTNIVDTLYHLVYKYCSKFRNYVSNYIIFCYTNAILIFKSKFTIGIFHEHHVSNSKHRHFRINFFNQRPIRNTVTMEGTAIVGTYTSSLRLKFPAHLDLESMYTHSNVHSYS